MPTVTQRLIEAHEEERSCIGRELHDDINQRIALVSVNLDSLRQHLPGSLGDLNHELEAISRQLVDLGNDVQALSHRLYSSKLEYLGIEKAASSFCRELSKRQNVSIDCDFENIPIDLSKELSLSLFRVLQEALHNAIKHSGSKTFQVWLGVESNELQLKVRDMGIGFDPEQVMRGHGLGLISMRERMRLVKGDFFIDSQPKRGTTVHARVRLAPRAKSAHTAG